LVPNLVPKMAYAAGMTPDQERNFLRFCSDEEACHYLATKVRRVRRAARISQAEFAQQAQVPLRTYKRFETHGRANLETFVQVLRALGRTQYLFMLFPVQVSPNPRETLEERLRRLSPAQFK
jgi:transcriptional regulator with XRE-family HTH domain